MMPSLRNGGYAFLRPAREGCIEMSKIVSLLASMAFAVLLAVLAAQSEAGAAKEAQFGPRLAVSNYYSHTTADDPMFHFGEPGVGHLHDFFCNTSTDAYSTYDSLVLEP